VVEIVAILVVVRVAAAVEVEILTIVVLAVVVEIITVLLILVGARGSVVVKTLSYKPEGRGFDSR
jgi:hypothetical protein